MMCDRLDKTWRIKKYQQITYLQLQFNCNLFTQARNTYWRILLNSLKGVGAFQIELKFNSVGFRWEGKTRVPEEKLLGARRRTSNGQWQTQPTYGVDTEIWPPSTMAGEECCHQCSTLAPFPCFVGKQITITMYIYPTCGFNIPVH